jgi:hypothetical protein
MALVQERTGNRLAKAQAMLLAKLNHVADGFRSITVHRRFVFPGNGASGVFHDTKKVLFQNHAARMSLREEARFDVGFEMQGNRHFAPRADSSLLHSGFVWTVKAFPPRAIAFERAYVWISFAGHGEG